jgi:carbon monoxide dehydrogenase subunit G
MEMQSSRVIPAPPESVWRALNDPAALKDCIPGCESLTRESDTQWNAVLAAKVGPVSATFKGSIELVDVVPPSSYTIRFKGQGGAAGFANGEAKVALTPAPGGQTTLAYAANAQVGGKLAQIGSRLIDGVAAKMADDFFQRFAARFAPAQAAGAPSSPVRSFEARFPLWLAIVALATILVTGLLLAR